MKERIAKLLMSEGLSASKFAEMVSVQPSGISHILAGRNKPGYDLIIKILSSFPKINPDWLLLGKGGMYRDDNDDNFNINNGLSQSYPEPNQEPTLFGNSTGKQIATGNIRPSIPAAKSDKLIRHSAEPSISSSIQSSSQSGEFEPDGFGKGSDKPTYQSNNQPSAESGRFHQRQNQSDTPSISEESGRSNQSCQQSTYSCKSSQSDIRSEESGRSGESSQFGARSVKLDRQHLVVDSVHDNAIATEKPAEHEHQAENSDDKSKSDKTEIERVMIFYSDNTVSAYSLKK